MKKIPRPKTGMTEYIYEENDRIYCEICGKLITEQILKQQQKNGHGFFVHPKEGSFNCNQCGKERFSFGCCGNFREKEFNEWSKQKAKERKQRGNPQNVMRLEP